VDCADFFSLIKGLAASPLLITISEFMLNIIFAASILEVIPPLPLLLALPAMAWMFLVTFDTCLMSVD
jgi:hypothetical protein